MRASVLFGAAIVAVLFVLAAPALAQEDGEALYQANCSQCHQAGGVGVPELFPPLAGNDNVEDAGYVRDVIVNGREGRIEVLGVTYDGEMAAIEGLSDAEIAAIIEYVQVDLQAPEPTTDTTVAIDPEEELAGVALVEAAARGKELFAGRESLENGGPACIACHTAGGIGNLSGPGLGPSLGAEPVGPNPHLEGVAALYAEEPLTAGERADLRAFLQVEEGSDDDFAIDGLVVMGLGGLLLAVGFAVAIGFRREDA